MHARLLNILAACSVLVALTADSSADTLVLKDGSVIQGEVISETNDEVVFYGKIAGIWGEGRFARARIESLKREPGDQRQASEATKPSTTPPAKPADGASGGQRSGAKGSPTRESAGEVDSRADPVRDPSENADGSDEQASNELVEVEVTGQGKSAQEAFDDAIRTALTQVSGTFVRSDITVENEKLVQDRIIAHSQGFIEKATKKGPAKLKDGSYHQDAVVLVRVGKVAETLKEAARAEAAVDGESLYARVKSMRDQKKSASEILTAVFDGFPANVLKAEVDGQPKPSATPNGVDLAAGEVFVLVTVDITVDQQKWKEWHKGALEAFSAIGEVEDEVRWSPKRSGAERVSARRHECRDWVQELSPTMSERCAKAEHLWLGSKMSPLYDAVSSLNIKVRVPDGEEHLMDGQRVDRNLVVLGLVDPMGRSTKLFGVQPSVLAGAAICVVPSIDAMLVGAESQVIGRPTPGTRTSLRLDRDARGYRALFGNSENYMFQSASVAMMVGRSLVFHPGLTGAGRTSQHEFVVSERASFPFGFIVKEEELPIVQSVTVELGFVNEFEGGPARSRIMQQLRLR